MKKWEYLTFGIEYSKRHKDWAIEYANRPPRVGLQAVLQAFGEQGWELVSLQPESSSIFPTFGRWHSEPDVYRATFKRLAEAQA